MVKHQKPKQFAATDHAARLDELTAEKTRRQEQREDAIQKHAAAVTAKAEAKVARDAVVLAAKADGSETAQAELNQHTATLIAATLEADDWRNVIEQLDRTIIDLDQQIEAAKQQAAQGLIRDIAVNELLPVCERLDRALDDVGRLLGEVRDVKTKMSQAAADADLDDAKGARRFTLHYVPWVVKLKLGKYAAGFVHHALAGQTFTSIERGHWNLGPAVEMDEPAPTETKAA